VRADGAGGVTVDPARIRAVAALGLTLKKAVCELFPDIPDVEPRERRCHNGHLMLREASGHTRCSEGCRKTARR
jgi:hypothetical protein